MRQKHAQRGSVGRGQELAPHQDDVGSNPGCASWPVTEPLCALGDRGHNGHYGAFCTAGLKEPMKIDATLSQGARLSGCTQ